MLRHLGTFVRSSIDEDSRWCCTKWAFEQAALSPGVLRKPTLHMMAIVRVEMRKFGEGYLP